MPNIGLNDGGLLYIGKGDGASGLLGRCHFQGASVRHSPRRSLAVLLRGELQLVLKGYGAGKWGLESNSEHRLTSWMLDNLLVAYQTTTNCIYEEERLVRLYAPPLNLTICNQGPVQLQIKALRTSAKREVTGASILCRQIQSKLGHERIPRHAGEVLSGITAGQTEGPPEIARRYGINDKHLRSALRRRRYDWHQLGTSWYAQRQSPKWRLMIEVAMHLSGKDLGELD